MLFLHLLFITCLAVSYIPIRYVVSSRRINYLQTILKRDEEELTRRIFEAQMVKPSSGDFAQLVKNDLESIGLAFNPNQIRNTDSHVFKKLTKEKISLAAFKYLVLVYRVHTPKFVILSITGWRPNPIYSIHCSITT